MSYGLFVGCQILGRLNQYDASIRRVADRLKLKIVDMADGWCCGPATLRALDSNAWFYMSGRLLALAEKNDLNIVAFCNDCYGNLKECSYWLKTSESLKEKVNKILAEEDLKYTGKAEVKNFAQLLYSEVGLEQIKENVKKKFEGLKAAVHYGCQVLRPYKIKQFDNPEKPKILDELVALTGAASIPWRLKLQCCGAPLLPVDETIARRLARAKLDSVKDVEADCIITMCAFCHIKLEMEEIAARSEGKPYEIPVILYTQLLGLALGASPDEVGLRMNKIKADKVLSMLK
jgi:heterodisulfide reductase subunit B